MKKKTEKKEIKHIIFDIGDVLFIDTEKVFDHMFHKEKLSKKKQDEYVNMIHKTERGEKPVRDLLKKMIEIYQLDLTEKQIEAFMTSPALIKPMWGLANKLSKNYPVSILTNNQKNWPEIQAKALKVSFKKFRMFNSAKLGMRKPERPIYEYVMKVLKASPEEILFIDDRPYNLEQPKKLGWKTIRFTGDMQAVYTALKKYGIKVKI
jgi:HAD superfamily hydrolase (TIGR01509 family)